MSRLILTIIFILYFSFSDSEAASMTDSVITENETVTGKAFDDEGFEVTPIDEFTYAGSRRWLIDGTQPYITTKIKPISAIALGTALGGIFIVQHQMQQNTIWKDKGDFNIQEDWRWTWGLDKGGHFYGAYAASYILAEIFMGLGFSWELGTISGSALGLIYTGYIEVLDGYSKGFGFSPTDFYAEKISPGWK